MSNLLALDQSSTTSGYAVFRDDKLIKYGHFTFNDTDVGERLCKIRNKIIELINIYDIDEIVFEDIQLQNNVGNNVQTFKVLAEVFGIVYQLSYEHKIPSRAVAPLVWKSKVGIKGKNRSEQKKNAQQYIIEKFNIKPTQDEADAICIGLYYRAI